MIELTDTTSSRIAAAFVTERTRAGSPAMGMVLTLVVVTDQEHATEAMRAARTAAREHPARVLGMVVGSGRGRARVNASVDIGRGRSGETALITLEGEVVRHVESVVLPLLLPDSPVVVWWASDAPDSPSLDPIGQLASRRITDAASATRARSTALGRFTKVYAAGDTDLAWSRITPWRALLAAALDQHPAKVTSAKVAGERISPSTELLRAWLESRLRITCTHETSGGPGITEVSLETEDGPVRVLRPGGVVATLTVPGTMDRPVSLRRRSLPELLTEELRHLDEDEVYAATVRHLRKQRRLGGSSRGRR